LARQERTAKLDSRCSSMGPRANAVFVPAGVDHRFSAYEQLSVLAIRARGPELDARA